MTYLNLSYWTCDAGAAPAVEQLLADVTRRTLREPGCRSYIPYRLADPAEAGHYVLVEVYDDEAAFKAHQATDTYQHLVLGESSRLGVHRAPTQWTPALEHTDGSRPDR